MTRKTLIILCLSLFAAVLPSHAQMTDDAILNLVAEGIASGKSQSQIGKDLLGRGVSTAQISRVVSNYKVAQANTPVQNAVSDIESDRPARTLPSDISLPAAALDGIVVSMDSSDKKVFGYDIFSSRSLSFEPSTNMATPASYVLGPGDEVVIDIWGANEASIRQTITAEGRIFISQVGPVVLDGLSIAEARDKVKSVLSRKYSSLSNNTSQLSLALGQNRSIQVNVMGEVTVPGTYRLSSFATVFNAVYTAGGITPSGSLRTVKVSRGGKVIGTVDMYSYIFGGDTSSDISLHDGDVIIVPSYTAVVRISGKVRRPMGYEMAEGESLSDLIGFAGGFTGDAYRDDVRVFRQDGGEQQVFSVPQAEFDSFRMADCDSVDVSASLNTFANRLEIKGAVKRPGVYQFGDDIRTVSQLVSRAGGLSEDAFTGRAQIVREKDDLSLEVIAIALKGIVDGSVDDVLLKNNDVLYIANKNEMEDKGDVSISGYVTTPGKYRYADNTSVEDLILLAGGLSNGASAVRVDVSRRVVNPDSTEPSETLAQVFSFSIKDGLMPDGTPDFLLKPYDEVVVRKSPGYVEQRNITITGEVVFPGTYTLVSNGETVSQVLERAGGVTPKAYLRGAVVKRRIGQYERIVRDATLSLATAADNNIDSTAIIKEDSLQVYTVGIELDKAVANPFSDYDLVLTEGDEIIIPEVSSTVSIQGDVLYPNTVNYISKKRIGYYVNEAGGYGHTAKKSKVYVVYMNGTVSSGRNSRPEPGCQIIVPSKPERKGLSNSEVISLGSSTVSTAAIILSMLRILK